MMIPADIRISQWVAGTDLPRYEVHLLLTAAAGCPRRGQDSSHPVVWRTLRSIEYPYSLPIVSQPHDNKTTG